MSVKVCVLGTGMVLSHLIKWIWHRGTYVEPQHSVGREDRVVQVRLIHIFNCLQCYKVLHRGVREAGEMTGQTWERKREERDRGQKVGRGERGRQRDLIHSCSI